MADFSLIPISSNARSMYVQRLFRVTFPARLKIGPDYQMVNIAI